MKTYKYFPGGNTTLLIENLSAEFDPSSYPMIAKEFLRDDIEQVGFIERGKRVDYRLGMMGGEFCINALRSLAMWVFERTGNQEISLESSGTSELVPCTVTGGNVSIQIPKKGIKNIKIDRTSNLILLEGIAHYIQQEFVWSDEKTMKDQFREKIYPAIAEQTRSYGAIGYIGVDKNGAIYPLVYVRETDSLMYETACGSGTLAAYIALSEGLNTFMQPSGYDFELASQLDHYTLKSQVMNLNKDGARALASISVHQPFIPRP